jgi:alpha-galactosidase
VSQLADTSGTFDSPYARLAPVPPRGWNSWNAFRCYGLTEARVRESADVIASSGLRDAGYEYVVVDDCWQDHRRGPDGALRSHPERFPAGIGALADYVHGQGLKFGLYGCPGTKTCSMSYDGYAGVELGSLGHEAQDAATFASWGVDYLKYDWCRADEIDGLSQPAAFERMRGELDATGRDIVLSISEYGRWDPWSWAPAFANLWRTTEDIKPRWGSMCSIVDQQANLAPYSRVGSWNDPDMLEAGNGEFGDAAASVEMAIGRSRAHLAMWAILNAPLMLGNDLGALQPWLLPLLTDGDMLAVQGDYVGTQGRRVLQDGTIDVWAKPMTTGELAVVVLNRGPEPTSVRLTDDTMASLHAVPGLTVASIAPTDVDVAGEDAVLLRMRNV